MNEPLWVGKSVILAIQKQLLVRFGGLGGLRDERLLESALARPRQLFAYEMPDIFALASCYAHGLVKNHPFFDGNKRIGFMAAYTFLGINGRRLQAPETEAVEFTRALAAGEIGAEEYAAWLGRSCGSRA